MINKTTLIGNLGNDPESRTLENGTAVCRISVATNENYKDKEGNWQTHTEWHSIICWSDMADRAAKLHKGQLVYMEGRLKSRKYADKDGIDRTAWDIHADVLRSLEKPKRDGDSQHAPTAN